MLSLNLSHPSNGNGKGRANDHVHGRGNGNGNGASRGRWSLFNRQGSPDPLSIAYHRIALQLNHDLFRDDSPRSVLLVTPERSHGSAWGIVELAACLDESLGRRVLLLDACSGTPDLSSLLRCKAKGFGNIVADPAIGLNSLVLPTNHARCWFLPAGDNPSNPNCSPDVLKRILDEAEAQYDITLISGGPVLSSPSALALAPHVGCVLLFATANETRLKDLNASQSALGLCQTRRVGVVLAT